MGASEAAVLWEKAARLAVLAAATVASELPVGCAPRRRRPGGRASSRPSTRRARPRAPTASRSIRPRNGRSSRRCPTTLTTSTARDAARRAARPSSTRSPARSSAPRDGSAVPAPELERLLDEAEAAMPTRDSPHRCPCRLGARPREERPPARRAPADRLRDRDRAAERRLRADPRLDRQRGDRRGRPLVRGRRPVPAAAPSTRRRPRPTSSGSRGRSSACRSATSCSRSCGRRIRSAGPTRSGAASSSCSRRPRPTRSAPSSSSSSTPGRCGRSPATAGRCAPLLDQSHLDSAWHAGQYQALPPVYVQNSALEIAWTRVVTETGTREGRVVAPFLTTGYEGLNIDDEDDFARAEALAASGSASLTSIDRAAWSSAPGSAARGSRRCELGAQQHAPGEPVARSSRRSAPSIHHGTRRTPPGTRNAWSSLGGRKPAATSVEAQAHLSK